MPIEWEKLKKNMSSSAELAKIYVKVIVIIQWHKTFTDAALAGLLL